MPKVGAKGFDESLPLGLVACHLPKDGCIRGYPEHCSRLRLSLNCQKVGIVVETANIPTHHLLCSFFSSQLLRLSLLFDQNGCQFQVLTPLEKEVYCQIMFGNYLVNKPLPAAGISADNVLG